MSDEDKNLRMSEADLYRFVLIAGERAIQMHEKGHNWEYIREKLSGALAGTTVVEIDA